MRQSGILFVAFSLICSLLTASAKAQDQALQLGTAVERHLTTRQSHTFTITLEENQYVQLVVDQRGIDVVVRVASPAGKILGIFDSPNGDNGPENVAFVGITAGPYRVTVSPLSVEGTGSGKYEIRIIELRPATEQEIAANNNLQTVKAKGLALLAEVDVLIPEIHSAQTRIRAQMQAAQLLWEVDQKRAWKYINDATTSIKDYVAGFDTNNEEFTNNYDSIMQLRFEVAHFLVERDPEAALNFIHVTRMPPNPNNHERDQTQQERSLELSIANQLLTKDPKRAFQLAQQNLKKGYSPDLANTVAMLRRKNPELATQLASEIADKLLGERLLKNPPAAVLTVNLLSVSYSPLRVQHSANPTTAPDPLLPEQTYRDLLQKAAQEALAYDFPLPNRYSPERDAAWNMLNGLRGLGEDVDLVVEGGAAAIDKKITEINKVQNPYQGTFTDIQTKLENGGVDAALQVIQKSPEEIRDDSYNQLAAVLMAKGESAKARQVINDNITDPFQRRRLLANLERQETIRSFSGGKVEDGLSAIAALKTPRERASMLLQILRQIGPGLKRANALSALEQARAMLAPAVQAPNREEMNALIELARAFSRYDSKRAFEILDPLVDQFNELCTAGRALNGFGVDFFHEDELEMQNGNTLSSLALELSRTLGMLSITNFERAKLASDRFQLAEVRLRAYLEIAQQTVRGSQDGPGYPLN